MRWAVEKVLRSSSSGERVVVDVDVMNCFGSFEWDSIRRAYADALPDMLEREEWCGQMD